MFIAMNRFRVRPDKEEAFERIWKERETYLQKVPGFLQFAFLRGDQQGQYVSHSTWESREAFMAWTQSEEFVKGHRQGGSLQDILDAPPELSLFQAVIAETPTSRSVDDSVPAAGRTGPSH